MRRLFIVNTYYQLMVAMQLNNTLFKEDKNVLLLSNHSANAETIYKRIEEVGCFSEVYFIESRGLLFELREKEKLSLFFKSIYGNHNKFSFYLKKLDNLRFDELIVYNFGWDIFCIYSELAKYNANLKFSFMEESLTSYDVYYNISKTQKLATKLRTVLGKKSIIDSKNDFYCFYPELHNGLCKAVKIPLISENEKTILQIKLIFDVKELDIDIKEKYIFFTSVYDFEGEEPIGEFDLLEKVLAHVGSENILIKIHPRDTRPIYKEKGIRVLDKANIPWEAIQLCGNFNDKIYLTTTSASVFSVFLTADNGPKAYFMFDLCDYDKNSFVVKQVEGIKRKLNSMNRICKSKKIDTIDSIDIL